MLQLLGSTARYLLGRVLLLLVVVLLLVGADWLRERWESYGDVQAALDELEASRESAREELAAAERELEETYPPLSEGLDELVASEAGLREAVREQSDALRELSSQCGILGPICEFFLEEELAAADAQLAETRRQLELTSNQLRKREWVAAHLLRRVDTLREELDALDRRIGAERDLAATTWVGRVRDYVGGQLLAAVAIVVAITLSPWLLRTLIYFTIAAVAERLRPIRIDPASSGAVEHEPHAVSIDVTIDGEHELLLRESALQSFSGGSAKNTKLLLDGRMPLTSLASGMYLLTSVTAGDAEPEVATVSVRDDLFASVCRVRLAADSSLVLKPHAVVGFLKRTDATLRIRRVWRLFSAHSWLTFQFRHLVFEGPCDVIVRGCRGIRIESPGEGRERVVDPSTTIGFSANLGYSNQRAETFLPYLLGREPLFNDRFAGDEGSVLYEEAVDPHREGRAGIGLQGFVDGVMRALGI